MADILLLLLFNSLLCVGVYVATQWEGSDSFDYMGDELKYNQEWVGKNYPTHEIDNPMILWWIRYYGSKLPVFWQKPLYRCLPCMASVWSVPVMLTAMATGIVGVGEGLIVWPTYVLGLAGFNYIVASKYL